MCLLEPELADVPRDRCLRDGATGVGKRIQQLELGADAFAGDHALDQPLTLGLGQLHKAQNTYAGLPRPGLGRKWELMLRKLLWSAIYGTFGALATIVSRRAASRVWRTLTGEEPPTKK